MKRFAIIPLLLLGLLSGGFRGLGNTTLCSFAVPNVGAVLVNSLAPSCLSNPADNVVAGTNWTTASTKYVGAVSAANFIIKSLTSYRDVEVSTWSRQGYTYLRLDGTGTAIYFLHNGDASTGGTLEIGIVTGLDQNSYPSGTYYALYSNADLVGTIGTAGSVCTCGYTKTATDGQYFTFGVSGFDIYVKYDGTQFATFKEYRQMNYGAVALKSVDNLHGFRNDGGGHITITPTYAPVLYSRYSIGELDMRDFGLRAISTTGSITSGSNSLVLAAKQNFKIGDWVIVEIGHEAGAGVRGTIGVGGSWPSQSYANLAAFPGSAADLTFAWARDTGQVYRYQVGTGTWVTRQTVAAPSGQVQWQPNASYYYPDKAIPRSLHAKISAISADGLTLTLLNLDGSAANAAATATGASVYLDNIVPFNVLAQNPANHTAPITPANVTLVIPAGAYALGGTIKGANITGWKIKGAGKTLTTLFSGKGMSNAGISFQANPGGVVQDLTLNGNYGLNYFGLQFYDTLVPSVANPTQYDAAGNIQLAQTVGQLNDTSFGPLWEQGGGINFTQSDNSVVQDVNVNEVFTNAVQFQNLTNGWAYRVTVQHTDPQQVYTQWQLEWDTAINGGCQDCTINSTYMMQGLEAFGSLNTQFIRPTLNNAAISLNASGAFLVQDSTITVTANSIAPAWSINNPLIVIDTNTGAGYAALGGTIGNATITSNYIDSSKNIAPGINVSGALQNVSITGGSYTGPNYDALSGTQVGPQGINSNVSALNTVVNGFTSKGTIHPAPYSTDRANIGVGNGSVINSCGDVAIVAPTTSGNTIPCP